MTSILLALCALSVAVGWARLYVWFLDRRAARVDSAYRAARLVAQASAEFQCSEPCDTTVAAEHRAEQMADATSGYYFGSGVCRG
ncbi:hypothetical protein D3C71_1383820 [compost metagenome]